MPKIPKEISALESKYISICLSINSASDANVRAHTVTDRCFMGFYSRGNMVSECQVACSLFVLLGTILTSSAVSPYPDDPTMVAIQDLLSHWRWEPEPTRKPSPRRVDACYYCLMYEKVSQSSCSPSRDFYLSISKFCVIGQARIRNKHVGHAPRLDIL